ncbi:hypothetical protein [Mitsuaria sp. 7]|uniref:hypothetical protein n=1 Tax=Mitsuaria sp. 7 TaxID=1658665 RepID=UPI000834BC11|nr:hypothetical protein [Mitsuaria sp. 7]
MFELAIVAGLWLALNLFATRRVLTIGQLVHLPQRMLVATIWLLPFIGALMALGNTPSRRVAEGVVKGATHHDRSGDYGPPPTVLTSAEGGEFPLIERMQQANGLPILDWQALAEWAPTAGDGADAVATGASADAIERGRHAWLLHLREQLGAHMGLFVTDEAFVLSSLDRKLERSTADYVATARARIQRLMGDVVQFPTGHRSILLVLDDEDDYYRYVSIYQPDGEFSTSSGMFIDAGCPHFVVVRGHLQHVEPVIAHELTHAALAHLQLPRWLDEGVAVNTERRVAGPQGSLYTPHELHAMHVRHWDAARIQGFWSGESFLKSGDDSSLLSYELARIIVEQMSREWDGFLAFLRAAGGSEDAGAAAAKSVFGIDLGSYAAALVEAPSDEGWAPASLIRHAPEPA